jgi:hypothetical protein
MFNFGGSNISINFNGDNSNNQMSKYIYKNIIQFHFRPTKYHEFN